VEKNMTNSPPWKRSRKKINMRELIRVGAGERVGHLQILEGAGHRPDQPGSAAAVAVAGGDGDPPCCVCCCYV
jgi:hypothetical protein